MSKTQSTSPRQLTLPFAVDYKLILPNLITINSRAAQRILLYCCYDLPFGLKKNRFVWSNFDHGSIKLISSNDTTLLIEPMEACPEY